MRPEPVQPEGVLFRISPEAGLVWREWDGEFVLYNDTSGDTHRLHGIAAAAFEALIEAPAGQERLAERIAVGLEVERDARIDAGVAEALAKFRELGLLAE